MFPLPGVGIWEEGHVGRHHESSLGGEEAEVCADVHEALGALGSSGIRAARGMDEISQVTL